MNLRRIGLFVLALSLLSTSTAFADSADDAYSYQDQEGPPDRRLVRQTGILL